MSTNPFLDNELIQAAMALTIPASAIEQQIRLHTERMCKARRTGESIQSDLRELLGQDPPDGFVDHETTDEYGAVVTDETSGELDSHILTYENYRDLQLACLAKLRTLFDEAIPIGPDGLADKSVQEILVQRIRDIGESNPESAVEDFVRRVGMMAVAIAMVNKDEDPTKNRLKWGVNEATLSKQYFPRNS